MILAGFSLVFLFACGCATLPERESLETYSLNGATYYSLHELCRLRNVSLDYDIYTRKASLFKDSHAAVVMAGDNLVLADSRAIILNHRIDILNGALVVPAQFKEQVFDPLFKPVRAEKIYPKPSQINAYLKRVVVDPGHGGHDPGAIGRTGLKEKDVNLDIAKRLANRLRAQGVEVVMTRTTDKFIPLGSRVHIANDARAELFISIHANASKSRNVSGFEIYYVSPTVNDSTRASYAARNYNLNLNSSCFSGSSLNLKAILWDSIFNYNRAESAYLAGDICRFAGNNLNTRIIGIKEARFEVLRGTRMPAILIEVGFLSNSKEEQLLREGFYREKLSESIMEGIECYVKNVKSKEYLKK